MSYTSLKELQEDCQRKNLALWELVLLDDMAQRNTSREESLNKMRLMWEVMLSSSNSYDGNLRSKSGLSGGYGQRMQVYCEKGETISGSFMSQVICQALKVAESNACMKKIVAAPTAGACGVLPAVLIPIYQAGGVKEEKIIESLYVAAVIGQIIASRAFISGAAGGCQAEVGSASSMAAGALVHIRGGSNDQILQAAAMAMKMLLGLVCDPVAGLVEVPCIKRNVAGAVQAVAAADMALAGIKSAIPVDQVIDAMKEVGLNMPLIFKETARGGLANTREGKKISLSQEV